MASLRRALGRLFFVMQVGIAIGILVVVLNALDTYGITQGPLRTVTGPWGTWWIIGLGPWLNIALGIPIVVLFIAGIVAAISGFASWRRGTLALASSAYELGAAHAEEAQRARQDYTRTLVAVAMFLFGMTILTAIVEAVVPALNSSLSRMGVGTIPADATTIFLGLVQGGFLFFAYYYGSRQLRDSIFSMSTPEMKERFGTGRDLILAGAAVGLAAAFVPITYAFGVASVASLVLLLLGVRLYRNNYDLWLGGPRPPPTRVGAPGVSPL